MNHADASRQLGNGIQTIQTTRQGEIRTSYFDEGVFGNDGWRAPVGEAGLVARNASGENVYAYDAIGPVDDIIDCHALNVSGWRGMAGRRCWMNLN